jgi:glycine oxidase
MATAVPPGKVPPDLIVVGGGVIGLSVALVAARAGLLVRVVEGSFPGGASGVAAGLLAPSLGALPPKAAEAFRTASASHDSFLEMVREASGHSDLFAGKGILEIALAADDVSVLNEAADRAATRFSGAEVARRVSDLVTVAGAMLHPHDGWIDTRRLLEALVAAIPPGSLVRNHIIGVRTHPALGVELESGGFVPCGQIVIAAGAWSPLIPGLPTRLPIVPARGEVIVLETSHSLPFAVACDDAYLVPRPGAVVVGSTFELVGMDARTTDAGRQHLEHRASRLIPGAVGRATAITSWAGLRPMTPDKLPIIDHDPVDRRIVYACGHGKNGLLLAGLTAAIVLDLVGGNRLGRSFPFGLDRFRSG